jgi:hypothetical protein
MKNIGRLVAVVAVLVTVALGPSMLMAAPVQQGTPAATETSVNPGLFAQFLQLFAAIWGGNNARGGVSPDGAIWGGRCIGAAC